MVYYYDGILYRVWGEAGIFILLGIICLLLSRKKSGSLNKDGYIAGVICVLLGIAMCINYLYSFAKPHVESTQSTLVEVRRNPREAPPLPFTMEYIFLNDEGYQAFYLDAFSNKTVLKEDLQLGEEYIIFYERRTDIIVGVSSTK